MIFFKVYEFWCQKHFQKSSKDEVGKETFRGVESESENFYQLELETELKSFIYL